MDSTLGQWLGPFGVHQVTVPQPPPGEGQGAEKDKGGGGVGLAAPFVCLRFVNMRNVSNARNALLRAG